MTKPELDPAKWPEEGPERDIVELNALLQVAKFLGDFDVPGYWRCRYGRFRSCKTIELPDFYNDSAWTGPLLKKAWMYYPFGTLISTTEGYGWRRRWSEELNISFHKTPQTALILVIAAAKERKEATNAKTIK